MAIFKKIIILMSKIDIVSQKNVSSSSYGVEKLHWISTLIE